MENERDKKRKETFERIVSDAIDHEDELLDERGSSKDKTPFAPKQMFIFRSRFGQALIALLIINIAVLGLGGGSMSNVMTPEEADLELKKTFGADYDALEAIDEMVTPQTKSAEQLKPALERVNQLFSSPDSQEEVFKEEFFFFFGDTVVYKEPQTPK